LDVAKLDAGELMIQLAPVDISRLIREVVAEQHIISKTRHQTVDIDLPRELLVPADRSKIRMVFENLLTNAGKYSPEGTKIQVSSEQSAKKLSIHVKDRGIGIAAKDMGNLFKRFSRATNAAQ